MIALAVAFAVTLVVAPGIRRRMLQLGIVDVPGTRSSHLTPTPRGGGLACLVGAWASLLVAALTGREVPWALLTVATALALVGYADDRSDLSAVARLGSQLLAGGLMGWAAGGGWLIPLAVVLAPTVVNMVNFMDGIDGITSLTMGMWGGVAFGLGQAAGVDSLALVGAVTVGCSLGFLPWNTPVARLFLGDVGSYLFGGLVTTGLLIALSTGVPLMPLMAPLALYAVDTGSVLVKRMRRGASLFEAHREHTYQRLAASGIPHVAVSALVATLAAAATIPWFFANAWVSSAPTALICALYLASPLLLAPRVAALSAMAGRRSR